MAEGAAAAGAAAGRACGGRCLSAAAPRRRLLPGPGAASAAAALLPALVPPFRKRPHRGRRGRGLSRATAPSSDQRQLEYGEANGQEPPENPWGCHREPPPEIPDINPLPPSILLKVGLSEGCREAPFPLNPGPRL